MELEFSVDAQGRTTFDKSKIQEYETNNNGESNDGETEPRQVDYSCKAVTTSLSHYSNSDADRNRLDELLYDCEIADCGLLPRTFWMPATGAKPRCALEKMALEVFHHHVAAGHMYDKNKSGAEWWVQIRPSPVAGRYAMHDPNPDAISKTGISFHWDKDEELRLLMGGSMFVHPHLSTVTYLTDLGAPTMVLNCRVNSFTGDWIVPGTESDKENDEIMGFVSWPKQGKHLSFDGRFLHAAPPDIMVPGQFDKQCEVPRGSKPQSENTGNQKDVAESCCPKFMQRRHRRVTFLVNIWLNYKPMDVEPFPDTMLDKLSGVDSKSDFRLFDKKEIADGSKVRNVTVSDKPNDDSVQYFKWPLGGCGSDEWLHAHMPLHDIRDESTSGGNVSIKWKTNEIAAVDGYLNGVRLVKGDPPQPQKRKSSTVAGKAAEETDTKYSDGSLDKSECHKRPRIATDDK